RIDAKLDLNATSPTASGHVHRGDNIIACIEGLLDFDAVPIPRLQPAVPDPHGTFDSMGRCVVLLDWCPFDRRMREFTEGVEIVLERPDVPAHDLHVFLRHRYSDSPTALRACWRSSKICIRTTMPSASVQIATWLASTGAPLARPTSRSRMTARTW